MHSPGLGSSVLAIAGAFLVAGCTPREPAGPDSNPVADAPREPAAETPTSVTPALTEIHADQRFGFEVSFPSGWTAREGPAMPVLFVSAPRDGASDEFVENVNVVIESLPATMTAEAYADGSATLLQTDLVDYEQLSRSSVDLAGRPAVRREYLHAFEGRALWVVSYIVVDELQAYVITGTAERDRDEIWRAGLDAIARSFRLTA